MQIPKPEKVFRHSAICSVIGSVFALPLGTHIFIGTLCTSLVLLLNLQFWIMIVGRLIRMVRDSALEIQESVLQINESQEEEPEHKVEQRMDLNQDQKDPHFTETDTFDSSELEKKSSYIPNTAGVHLFFFLKLSLLLLLLTLCAFVFSPICIIFSNTIIVLSLLSSSVWVI